MESSFVPKKQKNGEIELLRGLAACMILLLHSEYINGVSGICKNGNIAVEFFFLLSGFFMACSIQKRAAAPPDLQISLSLETTSFIWRKIKSFWPELFIACGIGMCFYAVAHHFSLRMVAMAGIETFGSNVLLLKMTGLTANGINGATWYLSSMVLACTILYPLFRRFGCSPVFGVLGLLMLGGIHAYGGKLHGFIYVYHWMGVTFKGNLRALAVLSIGASLYPLVMYLCTLKADKWCAYALTAFKWFCYSLVLLYSMLGSYNYVGYAFVALLAALVLSLSGLCADSRCYTHPVFLYAGRFSLPLYLSHYFYATNLHFLLPPDLPAYAKVMIYVLCAFVTALVVLHAAKLLRKLPVPLRLKQEK